MLYSTCHGVKICYYIYASESQRSLSRAPDLPLSAHSLIPVIKPTSCSCCYRCYFTEASLSTNHESQSSKARAAFRHVGLIKNLTFPLFADGISPIFIKHGLSLLPSSLPQAPSSEMTGTSAHFITPITITITLPHICPTQHTDRQTHTSATLPLITHYTADKIP